jgi:hypothetical protein
MAPTTTSPAVVDDSALKDTNAGVKKPAQKKKKSTGYKSQKSKLALQKMQVFCALLSSAEAELVFACLATSHVVSHADFWLPVKAHRDEYKDMTFGEQQKALGKLVRTLLKPKHSVYQQHDATQNY